MAIQRAQVEKRCIGFDPQAHLSGRLHGTLPGVAAEGPWPMPLYWLVYRHNNQISVVIEPGASTIHARMRAAIAGLDEGGFTEGHELPGKWKVAKEMMGRRLSQEEAKRLLAKFG